MQSLLADRFRLKLHRETKDSRVFVLRAGKSGMKLQPLKQGSCMPRDANTPAAPQANAQMPICGVPSQRFNGPNIVVDVAGMDMTTWVRTLSSMLGRTVINETELSGPLDRFHFEYNRDYFSAVSDGDAISIPTALDQQIGLELKMAQRPREVLVIDHVEKPYAN